jgi:hypothetical protein
VHGLLNIGEVSRRSGVAAPALRFYKGKRLISSGCRLRRSYLGYTSRVANAFGKTAIDPDCVKTPQCEKQQECCFSN